MGLPSVVIGHRVFDAARDHPPLPDLKFAAGLDAVPRAKGRDMRLPSRHRRLPAQAPHALNFEFRRVVILKNISERQLSH